MGGTRWPIILLNDLAHGLLFDSNIKTFIEAGSIKVMSNATYQLEKCSILSFSLILYLWYHSIVHDGPVPIKDKQTLPLPPLKSPKWPNWNERCAMCWHLCKNNFLFIEIWSILWLQFLGNLPKYHQEWPKKRCLKRCAMF